ncbi:hypothetical protein AZH51_07430 [Branchiibius sp. NY16-3462-2]|nr:hypothetical protein AZH51_07430 [Branchiibius sp. NY16-3462-2]
MSPAHRATPVSTTAVVTSPLGRPIAASTSSPAKTAYAASLNAACAGVGRCRSTGPARGVAASRKMHAATAAQAAGRADTRSHRSRGPVTSRAIAAPAAYHARWPRILRPRTPAAQVFPDRDHTVERVWSTTPSTPMPARVPKTTRSLCWASQPSAVPITGTSR